MALASTASAGAAGAAGVGVQKGIMHDFSFQTQTCQAAVTDMYNTHKCVTNWLTHT